MGGNNDSFTKLHGDFFQFLPFDVQNRCVLDLFFTK